MVFEIRIFSRPGAAYGRRGPGTNPKQDYETNPIRSFVFNTSSKRKPNSSRRMAALKPRGHPGLSSMG